MARAYPAINELAQLAPEQYMPPEPDRNTRATGQGKRWALSVLRTVYLELFAPGVRP